MYELVNHHDHLRAHDALTAHALGIEPLLPIRVSGPKVSLDEYCAMVVTLKLCAPNRSVRVWRFNSKSAQLESVCRIRCNAAHWKKS
jgi:hypothetical protein